jgi:hypothetical protein
VEYSRVKAERGVADLGSPASHCNRRTRFIAVRPFHEWQQRDERQSRGTFSWLALNGEKIGAILIGEDHPQLVRQAHDEITLGENRARHARRLRGDRVALARLE